MHSCEDCICAKCEKADDYEACVNCLDCQSEDFQKGWREICEDFHRMKFKKRIFENDRFDY